MRTKRYKLRWMRSRLQASEEVAEFYTAQAYCNVGLTRVEYSIRRLYSDEKEKFKVRINPNSLTA